MLPVAGLIALTSCCDSQLVLRSETKYFSQGSIIADSREEATGLMVITSGQVGVELPMESDEAEVEYRTPGGKTLLYVFSRG
jgi:signal-transduction protein with cAMP-binding, CBS, and nucleotidyltransferase domain